MGEKPGYLEGEPFDYSYLNSNITYEEMKNTLPYVLQETVDGVHSTLRQGEKGQFLFVQNYSKEPKTVTYRLRDYTAFEQWDLFKMTSEVIPTELTLKPGQSCVLRFSNSQPAAKKEKTVLHLTAAAEVTQVTENYLPLDTVRYSTDGVNFSRELPYAGVFQQLLQDRYEGELYIKHTFHVSQKPEKMAAIAEDRDSGVLLVNGHPAVLTEPWHRQPEFVAGDISQWIQEGQNEIVRKMQFHQGENVYYALFGEDVTETLLNCLSYDTELEPLYLAGSFGVFADKLEKGQKPGILLGSGFSVGHMPEQVKNLIIDGYPFFAGTIRLKRTVTLEDPDVILEFNGRFQAMRVWVNGKLAGSMLFEGQLDISEFTRFGENEIELELTVSNRNLFDPHHMAADEEADTVGPYSFELPGSWKDGESDRYRASYALVSVPIC